MTNSELILAAKRFTLAATQTRDEKAVAAATLKPEGLNLARQLLEAARNASGSIATELWFWGASLHWARLIARQWVPQEDQGRADLLAAVQAFARVYQSAGPDAIPEDAVPLVKSFLIGGIEAIPNVATVEEGPAEWDQLAVAILTDPRSAGDVTALDRAVDLLRRAVAGTPSRDRNRAVMLLHLAGALSGRHEHAHAPADLDEAIAVLRQATEIPTGDPALLSALFGNLSTALLTRFEQDSSTADESEAIEMLRRAIAASSPDDPSRARKLVALAMILSRRVQQ